VVEGILIFSDEELLSLLDIKVFVDTEDDLRLARRIERDTGERGRSLQSVIHQYFKTVRPMHIEFVAATKTKADIIIPIGLNSVALDLLVHRLRGAVMQHYREREGSSVTV
jgi:uridine kinase